MGSLIQSTGDISCRDNFTQQLGKEKWLWTKTMTILSERGRFWQEP